MAAKSPVERIDRLEKVVHFLAEDQLAIQKRFDKKHAAIQEQIAELASAMNRGFDQIAEQFAETDRRMRVTDTRMRESDQRAHKRGQETDARIDKLVVAIGKFMSQRG